MHNTMDDVADRHMQAKEAMTELKKQIGICIIHHIIFSQGKHSSKHYENQMDRASERGSRKISALLPGQTKCFVMRLAISSLLPSLSWPSAIRTPTERMGGERMGIFERANRTIQLPTAANVNRCMHLLCCVVGARELRASFIV